MEQEASVRLERSGVVATLVLSQPARMNALNLEMWQALGRLAAELDADDQVRVVIFRGEGDRAFSSGADISEFTSRRNNARQAAAYGDAVVETFKRVLHLRKPTIAMIQGACVGGGCELAIATDVRIAARGSRFGIPVARLGLVVGYEELRQLVHLVGMATALDLVLTGRIVDAEEAQRVGLISRLVEPGELQSATESLAAQIARGAPLAHAWHKQMVRQIRQSPDLSQLPAEDLAEQYACFDTADYREGYQSFLAKRPPQFQGK